MDSKPTIFFSHNSHDADILKLLKDLFVRKTGGSISVFLSSDGQSIKLGHNWVHSIEKALNSARIMVVFVTDNSIESSWIYFESGHAYAKGIRVIPVGLGGAQIGRIRPPLSLLQGFNITDHEGLNNLLEVVNEEFGHSHSDRFTQDDYQELARFFSPSIGDTAPFGRYTESLSVIIISAIFKGHEIFGDHEKDIERYSDHKKELRDALIEFFRSRKIECTTGINVGTYGLFVDIENAGLHEVIRGQRGTFRHHCRMLCSLDPHLVNDNVEITKDMLKELGYSTEWFRVSVVLRHGVSFATEPHTVSARMRKVGVGLSEESEFGTHRWKGASFTLRQNSEIGIIELFCELENLSVSLLHDIVSKLFQTGVLKERRGDDRETSD